MSSEISILTNNFNGSKFIRRFFKSLYSQSFSNWELIFYDNCSNDNSIMIIKNYKRNDKRIKIFKNKNHTNLGIARNNALKKCKSPYVAIWDIDDFSHKDRLKIQYTYLSRNKNIALVASNGVIFSENFFQNFYTENNSIKLKYELFIKNPIIHSSIMFNRNVANIIGGYDENFHYSQDYNFYIKLLANRYAISSIDKSLCFHYVSNNNLSLNPLMKRTIIKDQIRNLNEARKTISIKKSYFIMNYFYTLYYKLKLIFA